MDFYIKYSEMSEDELLTEIEMLNKKLFKYKGGPEIRNQLLNMIQTAESFYREQMMMKRIKKEDTVLEIGTIESSVTEEMYSDKELLEFLVTSYYKGT